MFSEADFCGWLVNAKPEILRRMVRNNESIVQYAKQFPRVIGMLRLAKPFVKYDIVTLDADKVMDFFRKNRPDLYVIVTKEWVQRQVDNFKREIQYL